MQEEIYIIVFKENDALVNAKFYKSSEEFIFELNNSRILQQIVSKVYLKKMTR
jgi:hypothetical protein